MCLESASRWTPPLNTPPWSHMWIEISLPPEQLQIQVNQVKLCDDVYKQPAKSQGRSLFRSLEPHLHTHTYPPSTSKIQFQAPAVDHISPSEDHISPGIPTKKDNDVYKQPVKSQGRSLFRSLNRLKLVTLCCFGSLHTVSSTCSGPHLTLQGAYAAKFLDPFLP